MRPSPWSLEYAQQRGWVTKPKQENSVKYQIREELNSYDTSITMYNTYKIDSEHPAGIYVCGHHALSDARRSLDNRLLNVAPKVVYEVEV